MKGITYILYVWGIGNATAFFSLPVDRKYPGIGKGDDINFQSVGNVFSAM